MELIQTCFDGAVMLLKPRIFGDPRGCFFESFRADALAALGLQGPWVQDNHSLSQKGTLRGIHFQWDPPQGKLVRIAAGRALDVAVDLRRASATFGQWHSFELDALAYHQVWLPPGFGHAVLALEDNTVLLYKCTAVYGPAGEGNIHPFDPELGIAWPGEPGEFTLSTRDRAASSLADYADAPRF